MVFGNDAMSLFEIWWFEENYTSLTSPKEAAIKAWQEQSEIIREISENDPVLDFEVWWLKVPENLSAKVAAEKAWDVLEELISDFETVRHLKGTPWDM